MWNNFVSSLFRADIDVEQEFILSPILSTLYISPIFHIFEKKQIILSQAFPSYFSLL